MTLDGATLELVEHAINHSDPLPGTTGFAGALPDGRLVRDVLGRRPLFVDDTDPSTWSFNPRELDNPRSVSAGTVQTEEMTRQVWELPSPEPLADKKSAVNVVERGIRTALDEAPDDIAVAFSGGVDSVVVASGFDGPAYVAGLPGSHDVEAAKSAATATDRSLHVVELSVSDIEAAVPAVARATGRTNAMDVAIALPLYLVAERAAADGYRHLAVGQGADELFGGYAKIARAPNDPRVDAETIRGAARETIRTLPHQLERDVLAIRDTGVEPVAPLLHDDVVHAALRLPGDLLVDDRGERKWAFRLAAREFVPDRVVFREKKAVQYGSLVARELDRLARNAGFKRRMDDHVSNYIQSRVE